MRLLLERPRRRTRPVLLAALGPGLGDAPEAVPPAPPPTGDAHGLAAAPVRAHPLGILIVDDDEFMRDMLPRKLRKALPDVVPILVAQSPEEALRILREVEGEGLVVLSDFDLRASMDGLQLLREVARERPATVRLLFSGHSRIEIGTLDPAHVHAFLEKPLRLDDLVPALLRAMGSAGGGGP